MSNSITHFRITRQEFSQKESQIITAIQDLDDRQLLAIMGTVNAYVWAALERLGAMSDGKLNLAKVAEVVAMSRQGTVEIEMPMMYLTKYLTKHWPKACHSEVACRGIRAMLSTGKWKTRTDKETGEVCDIQGLGLLEFESKQSGRTVIPPTLNKLDVSGMAILYRCAYRLWCDRTAKKNPDVNPFDLLPDHKGYLMKLLFDSIFFGLIQFDMESFERTAIEFSVGAIASGVKKFVMWFYSESFKITRHDWRRLIKLEDMTRQKEEQDYQDNLTAMGVAF